MRSDPRSYPRFDLRSDSDGYRMQLPASHGACTSSLLSPASPLAGSGNDPSPLEAFHSDEVVYKTSFFPTLQKSHVEAYSLLKAFWEVA